jgi:YVTN family beta-propeller protein
MRMTNRLLPTSLAIAAVLGIGWLSKGDTPPRSVETRPSADLNRSPIALAISKDGSRLLSANQTAGSVSLIDTASRKVLHELKTGERPAGVAFSPDGRRAIVSHWYGYDVSILDLSGDRLSIAGRIEVGPEPRGVAIAADGKAAYVAVGVSNEVVRIDLDKKAVTGRVEVGREPRGLALTPDGKRLIVGNSRSKSVSVVDLGPFKVERTTEMQGDNIRQIAVDASGKFSYAANMYNRGFATTKGNIDVGWVLGQRVTKVAIDGSEPFETLSLDPKGLAAADVHGLALSPNGKWLAVSSGGTHEILLFQLDGETLPWRTSGSRDVMPFDLVKDSKRFRRIPAGGKPTELAFAPDGKTLFAANYLDDSIQIVDVESARLASSIDLGKPRQPSLARQGEILFHDATRSFNQWYSCNTCHSDGGHTNGLDFDTMNDGWHDYSAIHQRSRKKVPTLRRVAFTTPWTWHGWQDSLESATIESFTKSMQGTNPSNDEVKAMVAYLTSLEFPKNPHRTADGGLSEQARRGEAVFRSARAACSTCHSGKEFTDGKIHTVGLEGDDDVYKGFNPPSLRGVYDKDPYLHDGRAKTLQQLLTGPHNPENLGGETLSPAEVDDLVAYLKSL